MKKDILCVLNSLGLLDRFLIKKDTMWKFISYIVERYSNTQYHSFYHAVDVFMFVYLIHQRVNLLKYIIELDLLALLISALLHDIGHFGINNQSLVGML